MLCLTIAWLVLRLIKQSVNNFISEHYITLCILLIIGPKINNNISFKRTEDQYDKLNYSSLILKLLFENSIGQDAKKRRSGFNFQRFKSLLRIKMFIWLRYCLLIWNEYSILHLNRSDSLFHYLMSSTNFYLLHSLTRIEGSLIKRFHPLDIFKSIN